MIPFAFIILGLILFFYSALRLLRFSSELSDKIEEINDLFSSDVFMMHKELKEEVDELNYSYYEILERQDERISSLETKMNRLTEFGFFNMGEETKDVKNISKSVSENGEKESGINGLRTEPKDFSFLKKNPLNENPGREDGSIGTFSIVENLEEEDSGDLNERILEMYKEGASIEKIASDLDVGVGMVEMICSIYHK